ncbi:MAG: hypothetical protein R3A48_18070 [Polyangiales bacterium]
MMKKLVAPIVLASLAATLGGCLVRRRAVVYQPRPVYVRPQPVVVRTQPVYVQQPTVYAAPPPVVQGTVIVR